MSGEEGSPPKKKLKKKLKSNRKSKSVRVENGASTSFEKTPKNKESETAEIEEGEDADIQTLPDDDFPQIVGPEFKFEDYFRNDLMDIVIDEISLEGLDGITIEALWTRLSIRISHNLPFSNDFQNTVWDIIIKTEALKFHLLPEPRPKLVIFDRFKYIDWDTGYITEPANLPEDIYPFSPISDQDGGNEYLGSCSTFKSRINITGEIRQLSLTEAEKKYGSKLVIVADQILRNTALGLTYAKLLDKIANLHYCILERIGRSRKLGEVTVGGYSLLQMRDSKNLFYLRKILLRNGLITKQPFNIRHVKTGNTSALLFHIPRFYKEYKSMKMVYMEQIIDLLKRKPNHRVEYIELKKIVGQDAWVRGVKKLVKSAEFKQYVRVDVMVPYRTMYPNASEKEWKLKNGSMERYLRILQLINPSINLGGVNKDEDAKDDSSDDEPIGEYALNASIFRQAYDLVYESGSEGIALKQVQRKLGVDFYAVRSVLTNLLKRNLVETQNVDYGRLHVLKYFVRPSIEQPSASTRSEGDQGSSNTQEDDDETLSFIANVLEMDKDELFGSNQANTSQPEAIEAVNDNPFKGHFDFIKEYRKRNRLERLDNVGKVKMLADDVSDGNEDEKKAKAEEREKFEEIFKNEHPYYSMELSLEHKRIEPLKLNLEIGPEFVNVLKEISNTKPSTSRGLECDDLNKGISVSSSDLEKIKAYSVPKTLTVNILLGSSDKASNIMKQYIFIPTTMKSGALIEKFHCILEDIRRKSKSNRLAFPTDLESDDECYLFGESNDTSSLDINLEEMEVIEFKNEDVEVKDFKSYLIKHFEITTCSFNQIEENKTPIQHMDTNTQPSKRKAEDEPKEEPIAKRIKPQSITADNEQAVLKEVTSSVKMEIYMGKDPVLHSHGLDEDDIETTIITSRLPENLPESKNYVNPSLSQRTLARTNMILDTVYSEKIISDISKLVNMIKTFEHAKRILETVDKKSVDRILSRLVESGHIRMWKIVLKYENVVRCKNVAAVSSLDITNTVQVFIDQLKIAFFIYAKKKIDLAKPIATTSTLMEPSEYASLESIAEMEALTSTRQRPKYKHSRIISKQYGYVPKFAKMKIIHELLFYLIYAYDGEAVNSAEVPQLLKQFHVKLDADEIKSLGTIYKRELSWKMFISPLPKCKENKESLGSTLICDIILRLPLSIFVKIFNIAYVIPELLPLLNDPIKRHVLLKNVPIDIRNACLHNRKCIFSIHEILCHLCYIGLLQFGVQKFKDKEQQFIYLNRRAILYDTTSSERGYHHITKKEYPVLQFYFENQAIVDNYWAKLWSISMNTKLGYRSCLLQKTITLVDIHAKPEMILSVTPKTPEAALEADIGYLPGDKLGACCFDSSTWVHVKRNWVWSNSGKKIRRNEAPPTAPITGLRKKHLEQVRVRSIKYKDLPRELQKKKIKRPLLFTETPNELKTMPKKSRKHPVVRKVLPRPPSKKVKVVQYDDLDNRIMSKMGKTRAVWSEAEDTCLIICHFAKKFLSSSPKAKIIPPIIIRDVMHRLLPISRRKTTSAYTRRRLKLLKGDPGNASERYCYFLENDKYLQKVFSKFRNRIANGDDIPELHIHIAFLYLVSYVFNAHKKKLMDQQKMVDDDGHVDYLTKDDIPKYIKAGDAVRNSDILYQNPQNPEDIEANVIKDIAHCSLGWKSDNSDLPLMLYRAYQRYADPLLKEAISWMRKHQIIAGRKFGTKHWNCREGMPIAGKLIHNSFVYSFKQITKYPDYIYPEAYQMFTTIYKKHDVEREFLVEKFEQGHGLGLSEIACLQNVNFSFKIPDDLLVLDPKITDHSQLIQELAVRYKFLINQKKNLQEGYDQEKATTDTPEDVEGIEKAIGVIFEAQKQVLSNERNDSYMDNLTLADDVNLTETGAASVSQEILRDNIKQEVPVTAKASTSTEGVEKFRNSEDTLKALRDLTTYLGNKQGENAVRISDLAYLLTKGLFPEFDGDEERLEKLNKHFLIMYPSSTFRVSESIAGEPWAEQILCDARVKSEEIQEMIKSQCIIKNSSHDDEILNSMIDIGGDDEDTKLAFAIINFIKSKGIHGASSEELKAEFSTSKRNVELHVIISVLIKVGIVFRAGIRDFRFVHVSENEIWTIAMDDERPISELNLNSLGLRFKLMPWIRINGTLNLKVLHNWIYVIQSYCLSHPFATLLSLMKRFNFLKPVDIFSLLEYLQTLDCLHMYTYIDARPSTLFSNAEISGKRPTNILDDFESIFVETDKTAIIKMGAFKYKGRTDIEIPFEE